MSKALDILDAIYTRAQSVAGITTFVKGRRQFNDNELDSLAVYDGARTAEDTQNKRSLVEGLITVEVHANYGVNQPGDVAHGYIRLIRLAIETSDASLNDLLRKDLQWTGDEITYPEDGSDVVICSVTYSVPHVTEYGNPD